MSAARSRVAVVIVNANAGEQLETALEHLERQTVRPDRVIVVDNGSTDGSGDRVGHVQAAAAGEAQPVGQVGVLVVTEERLVEAPRADERRTPVEHGCGTSGKRLADATFRRHRCALVTPPRDPAQVVATKVAGQSPTVGTGPPQRLRLARLEPRPRVGFPGVRALRQLADFCEAYQVRGSERRA